MLGAFGISRGRANARSRGRVGIPRARRLELAAIAAARRNNASLWSVRNDLSNVWQNSDASGAPALNAPIGYLGDAAMSSPATQATTANKPLLTRVPRVLGPELAVDPNIQSPGLWGTIQPTSGSVVVSFGSAAINSVDGSYCQAKPPVQVQAGKTYQLTMTVASATGNGVRMDVVGSVGPFRTAPGTYSHTATASAGTVYFARASGVSGGVITSYSVREVLEWSCAMQFDRANDYLLTSLLCGDAGTFIAAHHTIRQTGAWQGVVTTGSQPNGTNRGLRLRIRSDLFSAGVDAANASMSQTAESSAVLVGGGPIVNAGWWSAASINSSVNGAAPTSMVLGAGIGNGAPFMIGALTNAGGDPLAGPLALVCIANTVMPDADRRAIERYAGYLIGAPYAA